MPAKKIPMAIAYDFDGTLAPGNMQEQSFLPAVNGDPQKFWKQAKAHAKSHDMDEILAYMELMLKHSKDTQTPSRRETFKAYGAQITFFPGVVDWFDRINAFSKGIGVRTQHYIILVG